MLIENYNAKTVKISLTRREVIYVLILLDVHSETARCRELRNKIREQLDAFDQKQEMKK